MDVILAVPAPCLASRKISNCRASSRQLAWLQPTRLVIRPMSLRKGRMSCSSTLDVKETLVAEDQEENSFTAGSPAEGVAESVSLLKLAAKTRKVPATEVFEAIRLLEKAKLDPSDFLQYIGGTESPGRTWMLVFTAGKNVVTDARKGGPGGGKYFPFTAVQRFDAAAMSIENGVYLGPLGSLTFQGKLSWNKRVLAFTFLTMGLKIGSLGPFNLSISKGQQVVPIQQKDPFFVWFYADDEIIVARGRGGGVAFWCRCEHALAF